MSIPFVLFLALVLDALFGEPKWLWSRIPHPAVLMGRAVDWADARYNHGTMRRRDGAMVMAGLALAALILGGVLAQFGWLVELLIAAILLAHRSLVDHVRAVADALRLSLYDGRLMVARIVGRDTTQMDAPAVSRAAIESAAENFSDGVIAPAFWFLVAGLPGLLLYKITNTADSMIGYRTDKYRDFGWAAARLDDVLNLIPARLTALLIAAPHGALTRWGALTTDAETHRSPNAGWPEAAMAHAIDIALSGPRAYDGQMQTYPFVHPQGNRTPGPDNIIAAIRALWLAWGVFALLILVIAWLSC